MKVNKGDGVDMSTNGVVPKINIDVKANLTRSCERLADATPKGFSKIAHLLWGERDVDIIRYQVLTAAQTQTDLELVLSGRAEYRDGQLCILEQNPLSLESQFLQNEAEQELSNVAGNVRVALEALKDVPDDQISDDHVAADFFARWRREAKVIGDEELQRLWGRLLAEEIKRPETVAYRVIDTIKNITPREARLFMRVAPYVLGGMMPGLPANDKYAGGLNTGEIVLLCECGLLLPSSLGFLRLAPPLGTIDDLDVKGFVYRDVVICDMKQNAEFSVSGMGLTETGKQLLSICDAEFYSHENIGEFLKGVGPYVTPLGTFVSCYRIVGEQFHHICNCEEFGK